MAQQTSRNTSPIRPAGQESELAGAGLVIERAYFYRDGFRTLLKALLIMSVAFLVLAGAFTYSVMELSHKEAKYFAMSPNGTMLNIIPFDQPSVSENRMLQVAGDAATCVFTYDYVNYRAQLGQCKSAFTSNGWVKFTQELNNSKILNMIQTDQLVLSATRINAPVIIDQGLIDGALAWKVEVPIRVSYAARQKTSTEDYIVTMVVSRVSQQEYSDGIAINSFIAQRTASKG